MGGGREGGMVLHLEGGREGITKEGGMDGRREIGVENITKGGRQAVRQSITNGEMEGWRVLRMKTFKWVYQLDIIFKMLCHDTL